MSQDQNLCFIKLIFKKQTHSQMYVEPNIVQNFSINNFRVGYLFSDTCLNQNSSEVESISDFSYWILSLYTFFRTSSAALGIQWFQFDEMLCCILKLVVIKFQLNNKVDDMCNNICFTVRIIFTAVEKTL